MVQQQCSSYNLYITPFDLIQTARCKKIINSQSYIARMKSRSVLILVSLINICVEGEVIPCRKGYSVKKDAKVTFSSTDGMCTFDVVGETGCNTELNCNLELPGKADDCDEIYLTISDGVGGMQKYCGKTALKNIQPSGGEFRDLFVDATYAEKSKWSCTASCSSKEGTRLPKEFKKKVDFRCVCGLQNQDDRIVGGEDSKLGEFPWLAAVVYPKSRSPLCGAAVINDKFILSAAHCFADGPMQPSDIEILLHAFQLDMTEQEGAVDVALGKEGSIQGPGYKLKHVTDKKEKSLRFKVAEIIMHPLYTKKYDYDYALIRLEKRINFFDADAPTPICLPKPFRNETYETKNATVAGWGLAHEKAGASTKVLQKLIVPVLPLAKCREIVFATITDRMMCAGYLTGGKDACTGDSGGPLVHQKANKQWEQIGVVSWGVGCARENKPGFYARVTDGNQWIQHHSQDKDAKWCRDKK